MNIDASFLPYLVLLPFIASGLALFLPSNARNAAAALAGAVALITLVATVMLYPQVTEGAVIREHITWLPQLGFDLAWRMDGISWLFALLITGIGALIVLYAHYYMSVEDPVPRFYAYLLGFAGSMLGVVLSGNLIQLVFFWEMTSLTSFLLIGYWYHNANAREGARMALVVTVLGGFCMLVGVLVLGHIVGSYDIDVLLASFDVLRDHALFVPALVLMLLGAFTKSAQFPFHFWLPHAMAAPTPVSAYLHSATMVKAGIYLMIRLWPVMSGSESWYYVVSLAGLLTFLIGGIFAVMQNDLKGILAYSTISHLGLITLLIGLSTPAALAAAIFHVFNHATFKASLFMAAGVIDHETGTRDVRRLSGLMRYMPFTGTLAIIAAGAMAGVPLLNGFISKEMFLTETLEFHTGSWFDRALPLLATIGSAFSVLYSVRFIHQVFFGPPPKDLPREPHEPVIWMRLPIEFLVAICLIVGIIPGIVVGPLLNTAVAPLLGGLALDLDLAVWHGFTPALLLSTLALVGGVVGYMLLYRYLGNRDYSTVPWAGRVRARQLFDVAMNTLFSVATAFTRFFGTRRLQPQLLLLMAVVVLAGVSPFVLERALGRPGVPLIGSLPLTELDPAFVALWAFGIASAIGAAFLVKFHRLAALILTSGVGLVVCLTFVWLSAPDLAVTQLVVEIVTTVLLLLGLRWLPQHFEGVRSRGTIVRARLRRSRDLIVAVAAGGGLATLSYSAMTHPTVDGISSFFLRNSYEGGGGTNVVNVLLVDFRGFDTMGEITVLAIVGMTVFALLRRFRPAREVLGKPKQQVRQTELDRALEGREVGDTAADYLYVPRVAMHLLFPLITLFAIFLLMRGHNEPGGGFAGGVTMAIAFILQYMASGTRWVEERLRILPLRWVGAGLLVAAATGIGSWLFGMPFLTSAHRYVTLPLIGEVHLVSALFFDLGVFLLVIGATVLMLIALAHQSIRKPRDVGDEPVPSPALQAADALAGTVDEEPEDLDEDEER